VGDILDANGSPVMDSDYMIKDDVTSYWSSGPDGGEVEKGGLGEILQKRSTARNIFTYLGNTALTDPSNAFVWGESSVITPTMLGLSSPDTAGRDQIIKFIHGLDSYDENGNGITNERRDWIRVRLFIHGPWWCITESVNL
jgi:type IV pilus assembly protein PilY1